MDSPSRDQDTLDKSLIHGVAWTGGVKWAVQMLLWGVTIVVARLLTPEDYGVLGMAMLFVGLVSLLSEFGLGEAVLAFRELSSRQIAQLNATAMILGAVGAGLTILLAGPVALFFESPRLQNVLLVLSATFIASAVGVVPGALLKRQLRYKALALIEGGSQLLTSGLTLLLAWLGKGYWALVVGQLTQFVVASFLLVILAGRGFRLPRLRDLREVLTFSSHVIGSRISWYFYSNADYLVAGKLLGQTALGLYTLGFTLSGMPAEKIGGVITRVTPGIFSAVQDKPEALRRYLLLLTEGISLLTFGPILGLGLVAPNLIPVVLGDQWLGVVLPLQILSVGAVLKALTPLPFQLLSILKDARFNMHVSMVAAVVFPIGFLIGSRWGIAGIAAAWVLLHPFVTATPVLLRVRKKIDLPIRTYLASTVPAASAVIGMVAGVLAVSTLLPDSTADAIQLAGEVVAGATGYCLVLYAFHRGRIERAVKALKLLRG